MIYLELKENLIRWLLDNKKFEFEWNGKRYRLRVTDYGKLILEAP